MRKVAYAVSLLLFAYLAYTFYQYGRAVPQMAEVTGRAGLVSTNVTIDRLDPESGKLLYSLKAQRAVHGLQEIALEELEMAFLTPSSRRCEPSRASTGRAKNWYCCPVILRRPPLMVLYCGEKMLYIRCRSKGLSPRTLLS